MTELVLGFTHAGVQRSSQVWKYGFLQNLKGLNSEVLFIGLTLAVLQVLDAVLTTVGVLHFGYDIEANSIIRNLMISFGTLPALLMVKSIAIIIIATLCHIAATIEWVMIALKTTIILYLSAAIIPWIGVITFNIL